MIKIGVIGATGYAGSELVRLLSGHKHSKIINYVSKSYVSKNFSDIYMNFRNVNDAICEELDIEELAKNCDVIFIALPHGLAANMITENVLSNAKVIDLGADYRIKDVSVYEKWYGVTHNSTQFIEEAVYGLCEINKDLVKNARLVANPGCYTTCSILSLYPLLKEKIIDEKSIIIDAKSGVTGAGRAVDLSTLYCEVNENMKAYKIASHRHTPEIEEQLGLAFGDDLKLTFTPHLTPMNRGILATSYATLNEKLSYDEIKAVYDKYYGDKFFIRQTNEGVFPETKWVKGSNFFDYGFTVDERTNRIIVVGAIDNLIKGAAGQAVQNMNIMFGFDETEGIDDVPIFPC